MKTLTPKQWEQQYKPVPGIYEGLFVHNYPDEVDNSHLWSLITRQNDKFIVPGHVHNAIAFTVTQKPYDATKPCIVYYGVH